MELAGIDGKRALVTGAGRGLGRAIAEAFHRFGASVLVVDRDGAAAAATALALDPDGVRAVAFEADVGDEAQVEAMVRFMVERFGGLDHAINNAGILGPVGPALTLDPAAFDQITRVNIIGVWLCMKQELTIMRGQGRGSIVNVSSANGLRGSINCAAYSASKHAVLGLTKSAALELGGEGIRVNALCPGPFATALLHDSSGDDLSALAAVSPMKRIGALDEIGGAALFLCSDAASYLTGHALAVDGGMVA